MLTHLAVAAEQKAPVASARSRRPARADRFRRKGIAVLWAIVTIPIFLVLICGVVHIANLWTARVELENALEAAALAAVKEWGDAGGGSTQVPRQIGVEYAAANRVACAPVVISANLHPSPSADNPNANLTCTVGKPDPANGIPPSGNLIFGAITSQQDPMTFNAGIRPGCGVGTVLFDATGQGAGNLTHYDAWGISFQNVPGTPADLKILSVTIDLQAGGGSGRFDFTSSGPQLSPVTSGGGILSCQPDVYGFSNPSGQITFSPTTGTPSSLTITFQADPDDPDADKGFEPGDRIRFGARTTGVSHGGGQDDGDGIGRDDVRVTVVFTLDGVNPLPAVSATFIDNTETSNDCTPATCPIVHPTGIPNLPCPPSSAPNNNGQSYVLMQGGDARAFGVRAQATVPVQSLGGRLLGVGCQQYVSGCVTALYDCATGRARLIRVDEFLCPGP